MAHDILLETGTNEVEFLEFYLGTQSFGVNVAKVKQLIRHVPGDLTRLPESYPSVVGSLAHLDCNIPVVDLSTHLKRDKQDHEHQIMIITDFNKTLTGFIVDGVNKIHRITWDNLQPVSAALEKLNPKITGAVLVEEREVLILDFEYILDDINPSHSLHNTLDPLSSGSEEKVIQETVKDKRARCKIFFAEDSSLFRAGLIDGFQRAGFQQVTSFENGQDLLDAITLLKKKDSGLPDLVLTDIEMPRLDGLTLCKRLKSQFPKLPVVMLSSLITEQMSLKCEIVGADANISKKNLPQLLEVIDGLM